MSYVGTNPSFGVSESEISDTLAANQNNYSPTGWGPATVALLTASGANRDVTGAAAPTGSDSIRKTIFNVGTTNNIVLKNEDGSSSPANRFDLGADVTILPKGGLQIVYDSTNARWKVF